MHALIVDDNTTNALLLQRVIGKVENWQATSFTSPVEALATAAEFPFDIVLVDYVMPGMNGVEFTTALHRLPGREHVPVVLVTSTVEKCVRDEAIAAGAAEFIAKPIDPSSVRSRVRQIVEGTAVKAS